ncbi:fructose-6-phosphate aldolase [bacterium]|jgi:transaldolase|nr:fructose-6-phosphate aldolase [bacterium]
MEFFVDSAEVELIKEVNEMGLVDGVTTNPTLIKKAGRDHEETIREISSFIDGPISVETLSEDAEGIIKEAEVFSKWGKNIVIKVVMNAEGMKAVKELSKRGIKTNVTLIFSALQAMIAAKAGATYVSPFVGRLDDIGHVGMEIISDIRDIFDNYSMSTKILVASIRSPQHISEAAIIGADVSTVPPAILKQLLKHPLTDKGIAAFLEDAKAWKQND